MRRLRALRARVRRIDPLRADLLLAAAFLVESHLELLLNARDAPRLWLASALLVAMAAGFGLRRRRPLAAVVLTVSAFTGLIAQGPAVNDNLYSVFFVLLVVLYSAGRHDDGWRVAAAGVFAWAMSIVGSMVDGYPNSFVDYVLGAAVIGIGPLMLGRFIRHRTSLNEALREKAERLRRERAAQAERAAGEERTRIAGELHDVVAHAMSAMVVQAAGARRLTATQPDRARDAFGAVETTGREALAEIRRLLGVLRHEDEAIGLAPQPSLRHLASLVERTRAAGLAVDLAVDGGARDLPAGVDLTAYRLVQEALGGAREQGAAGRARVTVRYRPDAVDVEVLDDGASGATERSLPGVRERVALYGGQVQAGRPAEGGHRVRARLPLGSAA